jgi:hypothetical protein
VIVSGGAAAPTGATPMARDPATRPVAAVSRSTCPARENRLDIDVETPLFQMIPPAPPRTARARWYGRGSWR